MGMESIMRRLQENFVKLSKENVNMRIEINKT